MRSLHVASLLVLVISLVVVGLLEWIRDTSPPTSVILGVGAIVGEALGFGGLAVVEIATFLGKQELEERHRPKVRILRASGGPGEIAVRIRNVGGTAIRECQGRIVVRGHPVEDDWIGWNGTDKRTVTIPPGGSEILVIGTLARTTGSKDLSVVLGPVGRQLSGNEPVLRVPASPNPVALFGLVTISGDNLYASRHILQIRVDGQKAEFDLDVNDSGSSQAAIDVDPTLKVDERVAGVGAENILPRDFTPKFRVV